MANTKHTPAPWQINSTDENQVCDSDGEVRGCAPIAVVQGSAAERRANALLIAAAPELLAALTALVTDLRRMKTWGELPLGTVDSIAIAAAAIDKATGAA